ncbi:MAG: chloride channel protein [Synechococcales bacterium]|nr:chloride channel protein [Synechococcales bacterium]
MPTTTQTPPVPPGNPQLSWVVNGLQPSPETIVLLLAVIVGTGSGMGVVTFRYLIDLFHHLFFEAFMGQIAHFGAWTLALPPIAGGMLVGLLRWQFKEFGPSVSALISALQSAQDISPVRPVTKMLAASISLGSGASLGPEGPSVEIGANLGLLLGQALQVSQERQRLLLGAGAAAGVAAGFNAPIAGVFFALEVVLGTTFATSAVSVVLLSAVLSSLIAQIGLGAKPAFDLPVYDVRSPLELPLYLGLGLCASLVAIAYTQLNKWSQRSFKGQIPQFTWLGHMPRELHPILGGAIVGLVALKLPQILGIGYETVEAMLRDVQFSLPLLVVLLLSKLVLSAISLGSGLVGGVFAPALFLGASLGAAYGQALPKVLPIFADSIAAPPAYAMVGMAAVLAASARAPLTAILLLFELTRDYRIVLPLMAAVGLSSWLIERLKSKKDDKKTAPDLVKAETLKEVMQEAIKEAIAEEVTLAPAPPDQKQLLLQRLRVEEVMQDQFLLVGAQQTVTQVGKLLVEKASHSALVMEEGLLVGIVTLQDINRAIARWERNQAEDSRPLQEQPVSEICTTRVLNTFPDERVSEALDRMAARGLRQLPVLDREHPELIVGLLDQEQVMLACSLAVTRTSLSPYLEPPAEVRATHDPVQPAAPESSIAS